jgi:hypothetical protein
MPKDALPLNATLVDRQFRVRLAKLEGTVLSGPPADFRD